MKNLARATRLAHDAMNAVANDNVDVANSDYGRAQADYARRVIENRQDGLARAAAHNQKQREDAAARKAAH